MNGKETTNTNSPKSVASASVRGGSILGHIWAATGVTLVLGVICCGLYPLAVYWLGQLIFPIQANGSLVSKDGTPTTDDTQAVGSSLIGQSFSAAGYFHPRPSAAGNGYDATSSGGSNLGPLSDKLINGAIQIASAPASSPTTAPATQPAATLAFDGIRLRVIHYCVDNGIAFKLYTVKSDGLTKLAQVPLAKFQDKDGNLNDVALVNAFPHPGDPDTKTPIIAADFSVLIPADAVTASGSGLDPHISPANAELQAQRVADARRITKDKVMDMVHQYTDQPTFGVLGDPGVNVLLVNLALDRISPIVPAVPPTPAATTSPTTAAAQPATSLSSTSAPEAK